MMPDQRSLLNTYLVSDSGQEKMHKEEGKNSVLSVPIFRWNNLSISRNLLNCLHNPNKPLTSTTSNGNESLTLIALCEKAALFLPFRTCNLIVSFNSALLNQFMFVQNQSYSYHFCSFCRNSLWNSHTFWSTSSKGFVMLVSNCQSMVRHTFKLRSSA